MQRISFIKSIMAFNNRVLYNGDLKMKKQYSIDELEKKLFFNKIFIDNMHEVYQKHNCDIIKEDYIDALGQYIANINKIVHKIKLLNSAIEINRDSDFDDRLIPDSALDEFLIRHRYGNINKIDHKFLPGIIYFITIAQDGSIIISHFESSYDDIINHEYWSILKHLKFDNYIIWHLNKIYHGNGTVAVSIDKYKDDISKVEFNGDISILKIVKCIFDQAKAILLNPYIYIDDIKYSITTMMPTEIIKTKQEEISITFDDIFTKDILVEYPTVSFDVYLDLLDKAANNKEVEAIYISLYRIGNDDTIYNILKSAVSNGKYVCVNIELCAYGEFINQMWAFEMRKVGINVVSYGMGDIKVHSKLTLFKLTGDRFISQIGTGNYHSKTTRQYTDLSLITSNVDICHQILKLFYIFEGNKSYSPFDKNLLVTRYNARDELIGLINKEAKLRNKGYITIKCNAIDDKEINKCLDRAAINGCQIDLLVRGVCTWVPDQIGYNVRIKSIVWDKLEHSRVYCFGNVNPVVYIGSLDLVTNKLDKRIETLVRVSDPHILDSICRYLNKYVSNIKDSWLLLRSGNYIKE